MFVTTKHKSKVALLLCFITMGKCFASDDEIKKEQLKAMKPCSTCFQATKSLTTPSLDDISECGRCIGGIASLGTMLYGGMRWVTGAKGVDYTYGYDISETTTQAIPHRVMIDQQKSYMFSKTRDKKASLGGLIGPQERFTFDEMNGKYSFSDETIVKNEGRYFDLHYKCLGVSDSVVSLNKAVLSRESPVLKCSDPTRYFRSFADVRSPAS